MPTFDVHGLFDLSGRVAIVTGGSRGLGLAMARGFVAAGAKVVVASRKADACDAAVAQLESEGGEALAVPTHLGELGELGALVDATVERFGGVDILVNNAANALAQPVGAYTPEAWDKSLHVNLLGPVLLTQAAQPHLERSDHAAVLNVITAGAFHGAEHVSIYTAAKAGLWNWTRSAAQALAPRGIRVNALAPGPFDTDMVRANPPEGQRAMADATLLRRLASTDEIVGPALFLVSDAASYVTGTALGVDGGILA